MYDVIPENITQRAYNASGQLIQYTLNEYNINGQVAKVSVYSPNDILQGYGTIGYDSSGLVSNEWSYSAGGQLVGHVVFENNSSGQVSKISSYYSSGQLIGSLTIEYNESGQMAKNWIYSPSDQLVAYSTIEYNVSGQQAQAFEYAASGSLQGYAIYEYDMSGASFLEIDYSPSGRVDGFSIWETDNPLLAVVSSSPADGAADVSSIANIVFTFNMDIARGSGSIVLKNANGTIIEKFDVATSSHLSFSGSTLTIDPTNILANSTHYSISFSHGAIKDLAGKSYLGSADYDFTTALFTDTIPPAISSFSPAPGATDVGTTADIVLTFSEPIQRGTGSIVLKTADGAAVETFDAATDNSHLSIAGANLTVVPTKTLANSTHYYLTFDAGTIKDLTGNTYAGTTSYDFTTVADTIPPEVSSFRPADGATEAPIKANIVLTFNEPIARGTGNIVLKTADGTTVETFSVATSSHLSISNASLTIDPANTLALGTHYSLLLDAGVVKDLAGNAYIGTSSYDFTTEIVPDTTPPLVSTFNPVGGATGMSITANIALTFSEPIQRGTGNIVLKTVTGTTVETFDAATSSHLSFSGSTLTIDPASTLASGTHYFLTFTSGSIMDLDENPFAGTSSYDFTTVADTSGKRALPGFDKAYYLNAKLAALQTAPGTAASWVGKDIGYLESVLAGYGLTAESHYMTYGYKEGLAPNAFFNPAEYTLAKATDMFLHGNGAYLSIAAAKADFEAKWPSDPYQHYLQFGAREGINPSNNFDESLYYDAKLVKLLADSHTASEWTGKTSNDLKALFDSLGISPLQHYMMYGANEGIAAPAVPSGEQVHINLVGVSSASDSDHMTGLIV